MRQGNGERERGKRKERRRKKEEEERVKGKGKGEKGKGERENASAQFVTCTDADYLAVVPLSQLIQLTIRNPLLPSKGKPLHRQLET